MAAPRRHLLDPFVRGGILVGAVAAASFLAVHAHFIEPIWVKGASRAVPVAILGGGLVGTTYRRVYDALPVHPRLRGAFYGSLYALFLVPFALLSHGRLHGAPPWETALLGLVLVPLTLVAIALAVRGHEPLLERPRVFLTLAVVALVGADPALFLLAMNEILAAPTDTPSPFPMTLVLMGLFVASGVVLDLLAVRTMAREDAVMSAGTAQE